MWPPCALFWPDLARCWTSWRGFWTSTAAGRLWRGLRLMLTVSMFALLMNGCAGSAGIGPMPPRPRLESLVPMPDGGICMNHQDAAELLLYIDLLERR